TKRCESSNSYAKLPKISFLFIQAAGLVYHHGNAVYLITRQRVSYLRLDDIQDYALTYLQNVV
ncbi:MAG: hypothetical protein J6C26_10265, partial [Clostridia bacterium]|nr:hypothetical protein [Clostridia bacterium]